MAVETTSRIFVPDSSSTFDNVHLPSEELLENYLPPHPLTENTLLIGAEKKDLTFTANDYLFSTSVGDIIIDCGPKEGLPGLERNLALCGKSWDNIIAVFATHCHNDHLGAGKEIQEKGIPVIIPRLSYKAVSSGDYYLTASYLYNKSFEPFEPDGLVEDGDILYFGDTKVEVDAKPGHSPDSTDYIFTRGDDRTHFVGDLLWGNGDDPLQSDKDIWFESLQELATQNPTRLLPGHANAKALPHAIAPLMRQLPVFGKDIHEGFHGMWDPWYRFSL